MLGAVRAFFDFLAKMGLSIRDDPPKTVDLEGREWGPETRGLVLSATAREGVVSAVLRNTSAEARRLNVPEFSRWFELSVEQAELTAFGAQLLKSRAAAPLRPLDLAPGEAVEAELPIQSIYRLNSNFVYDVCVSCVADADTLISNSLKFRLNS